MFSVRWWSAAGGAERISDGSVQEGISLFFGGKHSLLRSWLDFILVSWFDCQVSRTVSDGIPYVSGGSAALRPCVSHSTRLCPAPLPPCYIKSSEFNVNSIQFTKNFTLVRS